MFQILILQTALVMGQAPAQHQGWHASPTPASTPTQLPSHPIYYTSKEGVVVETPEVKPEAKPAEENGKDNKNGNGNGDDCNCEEKKEDDKKEDDKKKKCIWCTCGELGDPWKLSSEFLCEESQWDFGGWIQLGYHSNNTGIPGGAPNVAGTMFNNQRDRVNLHQAWGYVERKVDGKHCWDFGGRADILYGIDGPDTQAFGGQPGTWDFLNGWGSGDREAWALPQVYLEAAYKDFSIKAGKFFTLQGYETVAATGNFFYSHAFTFFFSEPFTHTGVLGTWKASDKLSITGGYVTGNDTAFESVMDGAAFLGNITYTLNDNVTLGQALNIGDLGATGTGYHSTTLVTVKLGDNWEYVGQCDLAKYDFAAFDSTAIVNYLFYTWNECTKFGTRGEWYKVQGVSFYDITAGVNFRPHANVVIRPEYRYQWSPAVQGGTPAPLGIPVNQHIFGVDVIFTF